MADLGKEFLNTIKKSDERKTQPFDSAGTVTRVKDGVAYVHFAGGVDETPVKLTINAQAGDEVQVRVADGRAWLMGNATRPPTDDAQARRAINLGKQANDAAVKATKDAMVAHEAAESASASAKDAKDLAESVEGIAQHAEEVAESVEAIAERAETSAGEAKSAADKAVKDLSQVENVIGVVNWIAEHGEMISQAGGTFDPAKVYFIVDPNGDYHIGNTHYSIVQNPVAEDIDDYYILNIDESVQNYVMTHLFVDNEGLWLIPEENATVQTSSKKILIATGGQGHDYPVAGTYIIGKNENDDDTPFAQFTSVGATISANDAQIAHLGYGMSKDDEGHLTEQPYYTFGLRNAQAEIGGYSTAIGYNAEASGHSSYAEGAGVVASGDYSHAEGTTGSVPDDPGLKRYTMAIGEASHAEGAGTIARGNCSHAEGEGTEASGLWSHAEGEDTVAQGMVSHAEGQDTKALGNYSHSQNRRTVAGYENQTVMGRLNDNQPNTAFEIGNGTDEEHRSNAFTVDWDGNVKAQGWAGFVQMFAGATAPSGWLFCDGSEVAVADYPLLYAVIGNTYGTPSDSDHFLLPDLKNRFPVGVGAAYALNDKGGSAYIQEHSHSFTQPTVDNGGGASITGGSHHHATYRKKNAASGSAVYVPDGGSTSNGISTTDTTHTHSLPNHTHRVQNGAVNAVKDVTAGNGGNLPPYIGLNFIICTGETS